MQTKPIYDTEGHRREEQYFERCTKCNGTGRFRALCGNDRFGGYYQKDVGKCFACDGKGGKTYKTSPAERQKARDQASARRERGKADNAKDFAEWRPDLWAWLQAASERGFEFAASLIASIEKYGELTEKQLAAAERCAAADKARNDARQAEQAQRAAAAPAIASAKLEAAFDHAKASGLKRTKMRFDGFEVKPAPASGRNAGAYYVTSHGGGTYFGKIQGGKFLTSRGCDAAMQAKVQDAMQDPLEAATYFGRHSGTCSCCGRTLTDPASIEAGIGPICAGKFGL